MALGRPFPIDKAFPNALDIRQELGGMLTREGVFPSATTVQSGIAYKGSGWAIGARDFVAVCRRGSSFVQGYGAALLANVGWVGNAWTIPGAPASGSRIDLLWVKAADPLEGDALTTPSGESAERAVPIFGITQGVASATPARPTLPAGAVEIAEARTTAGASSNAGTTLTQTYRFASAPGIPLLVRDATTLPTPSVPGERAYALDQDFEWIGAGGGWEPLTPGTIGAGSSMYEGSIGTSWDVFASGSFTLKRATSLLVTAEMRAFGTSSGQARLNLYIGTGSVGAIVETASDLRLPLNTGALSAAQEVVSGSRFLTLPAGTYNYAAKSRGYGATNDTRLAVADGVAPRRFQIVRLG